MLPEDNRVRYTAEEKMLHFLIAGGMLFQLIMHNWMQRPQPGETITASQALLFGAHEFVGVGLLMIVVSRFMLTAGRWKELLRLFPWFETAGRQSLVRELKAARASLLSGNLKDSSEQDTLAKTVHGLGLLLALGLGLTGLTLFILISSDEVLGAPGHAVMEVHELMGTLLWVFVIAHISMAIYHQFLGHRVLQYIFWPERE